MPQCWLSNWTAHAMALARVKPEVFVVIPLSLSHFSLVTCFATRECFDWMVGNGAPPAWEEDEAAAGTA